MAHARDHEQIMFNDGGASLSGPFADYAEAAQSNDTPFTEVAR